MKRTSFVNALRILRPEDVPPHPHRTAQQERALRGMLGDAVDPSLFDATRARETLRRLGCIDARGHVTAEGRAATQMNGW